MKRRDDPKPSLPPSVLQRIAADVRLLALLAHERRRQILDDRIWTATVQVLLALAIGMATLLIGHFVLGVRP